MLRRDFLKNSIGALLGVALTSNKVLASVVETLTPESPKVLLYLIQNKKGQWKVRGTKWIDIATKKLDSNKVLLETFKPLEIVSNDVANKIKNELWIKYNCSGEKGAPLNIVESEKRARKAHHSPKMKKYLQSDEWKKNWSKGKFEGGKKSVIGKRNKESGWMNKIRPEGQLDYFNTLSKEERRIIGIKGGKAASIINLASGQVQMAQKLAGESRRKQVINIETGEVYVSLKEVSKTFNLHYGSLKNKLNENGRKNNTIFRYKK
jgi:hypothetical protein